MPRVPERKLSYGELRDKLRPRTVMNRFGTLSLPVHEESLTKGDGIVRVSRLPHPFKCSKCEYVATGRGDFNDHWSLEH